MLPKGNTSSMGKHLILTNLLRQLAQCLSIEDNVARGIFTLISNRGLTVQRFPPHLQRLYSFLPEINQ